jgi:hypothetical protein
MGFFSQFMTVKLPYKEEELKESVRRGILEVPSGRTYLNEFKAL